MPALLFAPVAALAAVSLATALALFAYGRRYRGATETAAALSRVRRALRVTLPLAYVVALAAMVATGWLDAIDAAVEAVPGGGSAVGGAVTLALGLTAPVIAVVAGYLGAFPAVRDLRGADISAATAVGRLARYAAAMVALLTAAVVGVTLLGDSLATGVGFFGAVAGLLALVWTGSPWLVRVAQSTRAPTDAERERVARLCADAEFDPQHVRVLEVADAKQAFAFVRGLPGRRHLFVSDYLLAELDDATLRAHLALQAGRARVLHLEVKLAVVVGTVALVAGLLTGLLAVPGVGESALAALVVVAGVLGLWAGQRLVYRADDYAVDRTSRETVEATLRRFADLNDVPMEWGRLTALRRMEPSLTRRIDRLRDWAAREETRPDRERQGID